MENLPISELDLEIYDIWYKPFWKSTQFIVACSFLLIILVFLIIWFVAKRKKTLVVKKITLEDIKNKINSLNQQIETMNDESFYCELMMTLKQLTSVVYGKDLSCKTDEELTEFLEYHIANKDYTLKLISLKNNALIAKFAKYSINRLQKSEDIRVILNLIHEIKASERTV